MIKHLYDVRLIGQASADAKMEMAGDRPIVKFSLWVSSGKRKDTDAYQKPFYFNVKCWGDSVKDIRKGDHVELFGYMTRREYKGKDGTEKTWDEVTVKTDEKKVPMIQFASDREKTYTRGVSDEAVASGKAPVIQHQQSSLEITDEDIPF